MKTCAELSTPLELAVHDALLRVIDPEIGENIVDLGLVYGIEADARSVKVELTMTSPACPMGEMVLDEAHAELAHALPGAAIERSARPRTDGRKIPSPTNQSACSAVCPSSRCLRQEANTSDIDSFSAPD